jgi:hypothetical protein
LIDVPGVAGFWRGSSAPTSFSKALEGQQITYLFLDGDPIETSQRLRLPLERRWGESGATPLLAAPFYTIVPHQWMRHLP